MKQYKVMVAAVTVILVATSHSYAKRMAVKREKANVADVVSSINDKLKETPNSEELLFRLAQVHAAAYASKDTKIEVRAGTDKPWFGYDPRGIPFKIVETDIGTKQRDASLHLGLAISLHRDIIKLNPDHYLARLGLAWCMEQRGEVEKAKALYRALIEDALPHDRKIKHAVVGTITVSTEASQRLISILQEEIDALKKQSNETEENIRRIMI